MGSLLAGLTTRGRAFLAAGLAAGVLGLGLGQRALLSIGGLLILLPLLSVLAASRTRYRIQLGQGGHPGPRSGRADRHGVHPARQRVPAADRAAARRGHRPVLARSQRPGSSWTGSSPAATAQLTTRSSPTTAASSP